MNIIWCVVDCLRYDALSLNNYRRPTSVALDDRLFRDFVSFEDACTQSAFTFSVLSSMITGAYPSTHGALRFSDQLADEIPTLRDMWAESDYESHAIPGMNFVGSEWGTKRAFDSVHNLSQAKSQRESSQARADEVRKKTEDVLSTNEDSVSLSWFF